MMLVGQKSYSLVKFKLLNPAEAEKLLHQTRDQSSLTSGQVCIKVPFSVLIKEPK